ncbi:MAG: hypothetical protein GKR93_07070 [Gammaproteobacteria bacterium]|nr:hypothetical protein [Gammaproteobacteria bacterium]
MTDKLLPPEKRTAVWKTIDHAARQGQFVLPVCEQCDAIQYPPREICHNCLHDGLQWQEITSAGEIIASTALNASTSAFFREHLPHPVALIKLDAGPLVYAHLARTELKTGDRVELVNRCDINGRGVFIALSAGGTEVIQAESLRAMLSEQRTN